MPATDPSLPMTDIHDIKPLEIWLTDGSWLFYLLGAILILLLIGSSVYYWKKFQRRKQVAAEAPVPPHEAALSSLDALADVETMDGKTFYYRLSSILRTYIHARYGINALEMTTEELLPKIVVLDLSREIHQELNELLRSADPVKFAAVPAAVSKMRQDLAFVRTFIKQATGHGL